MLINKLFLLKEYNNNSLIIFKLNDKILGGKYNNKYLLSKEILKESLLKNEKLLKILLLKLIKIKCQH